MANNELDNHDIYGYYTCPKCGRQLADYLGNCLRCGRSEEGEKYIEDIRAEQALKMLKNVDFRDYKDFLGKKCVLTVTDPPYNIGYKYGEHKDNMTPKKYINFLSKIPKPCVIIHYPEETIRYVFPALGMPEKVMFWCYHSHTPRAVRMISFIGIKPDLSKYKIPYRNTDDKRIKKMISQNKKTGIKEWFLVEQVKNISKEYQGYANQIPEKVIDIILKVCQGQFGSVYDPFCGSGTTLKVAFENKYWVFGCDIDPKAIELSKNRLKKLIEQKTLI